MWHMVKLVTRMYQEWAFERLTHFFMARIHHHIWQTAKPMLFLVPWSWDWPAKKIAVTLFVCLGLLDVLHQQLKLFRLAEVRMGIYASFASAVSLCSSPVNHPLSTSQPPSNDISLSHPVPPSLALPSQGLFIRLSKHMQRQSVYGDFVCLFVWCSVQTVLASVILKLPV